MTVVPVRHGDVEIDAAPHLAEAFRALRLINPAHFDLFAAFFRDHWNTGVIERTMIKAGLPDDFFLEIDGYSEREAIQAIAVRAFHNIVREAAKTRETELRSYGHFRYTQARCVSDGHGSCAEARRLHGKVVELNRRSDFPLAGCKSDWCSCSWSYVLPGR